MFDVQTVDRDQIKRHHEGFMAEAAMADEPEDPDAAADRLEAALERSRGWPPFRPRRPMSRQTGRIPNCRCRKSPSAWIVSLPGCVRHLVMEPNRTEPYYIRIERWRR